MRIFVALTIDLILYRTKSASFRDLLYESEHHLSIIPSVFGNTCLWNASLEEAAGGSAYLHSNLLRCRKSFCLSSQVNSLSSRIMLETNFSQLSIFRIRRSTRDNNLSLTFQLFLGTFSFFPVIALSRPRFNSSTVSTPPITRSETS